MAPNDAILPDEAEDAKKQTMLVSSKQPWYWRMPHHDDHEAKRFQLDPAHSLYRTVHRKFHKDPRNSTPRRSATNVPNNQDTNWPPR